jgi:hypothetical protein
MFLGIPPKPSQPSLPRTWRSRPRSLRSLGNIFLPSPLTPYTQFNVMTKNFTFRTAGGRIECVQCQAMAKSTRQQCGRPASSGKRVCKLHGGRSTGPRTQEGRQRCAAAKTIHGQETTSMRTERRLASARLAVLEWAGHVLGFMHGARTRGRKPDQMGEAYPELQDAAKQMLLRKVANRG